MDSFILINLPPFPSKKNPQKSMTFNHWIDLILTTANTRKRKMQQESAVDLFAHNS